MARILVADGLDLEFDGKTYCSGSTVYSGYYDVVRRMPEAKKHWPFWLGCLRSGKIKERPLKSLRAETSSWDSDGYSLTRDYNLHTGLLKVRFALHDTDWMNLGVYRGDKINWMYEGFWPAASEQKLVHLSKLYLGLE